MGFGEGFTAPFAAAVNPGRVFNRLREALDYAGPWMLAPLWLGASMAAVFFSFLLTYFLIVIRGFVFGGLLSGFSSMVLGFFSSIFYSAVLPFFFGFIDPLVSLIALLPAPRERPVYYVFAARAGSMLPYALKPPILVATTGHLSLKYMLFPRDLFSWLLALLGLLLTAYGVKKTVRVPILWALLAASAPLALRLSLGFIYS